MSVRQSICIACLALLSAGGARSACAAAELTYKVSMLHPAGYDWTQARGVSNNFQVGFGTRNRFNPSSQDHALLWNGNSESVVDLHPDSFYRSLANSISGNIQVGYAEEFPPSRSDHALLWRGTAESVVDLHPAGFSNSKAVAAWGETQVGVGEAGDGDFRALLWNGSASSVVDLHPEGFVDSGATGVFEAAQVGWGNASATESSTRALLWHGTAESVVNLHPNGYVTSSAHSAFGDFQVGTALKSGSSHHAMAWQGTAASAVDLHPADMVSDQSDSFAVGVNGTHQVGQVRSYPEDETGFEHAFVWRGTAATAVDLHPFLLNLPIDLYSSTAFQIDSDGTIAGWATDTRAHTYAVLWKPQLVGDYNGDRVVDSGDYVVWRDSLSQSGDDLPADGDGDGEITAGDYEVWKLHFGGTFESMSGAASGVAKAALEKVPEPSAALQLLAVVVARLAVARHRRRPAH